MHKMIRRLLAAAGLTLCSVTAAAAHPHVWADMRSSIIFREDGKITGVRVEWTFDKAYSSVATEGLDTNGDGVISPDELAPLTKVNLASLKTYDYFIFLRMKDAKQAFADPVDYSQSYAHGRLTLKFTLPLQGPVNPRDGTVSLKVYDPEFFIDFEYSKAKPFGAVGTVPKGCHEELHPTPSNEQLNQTLAMLSTKPVDWKPDDGQDFGGMFAQAITVECAP